MASRGRRGGAPAREDEPRRDERAEQQAPAPQGSVLPPPPPVDYGVFMQGLVQAMQTQAHTQAALQAQLEAQQAQVPAQDHGGGKDEIYPWLREVGVAERRPVRTSRDVTSGRSSRPRHRKVLYFPHRRLWIMEYSCKV
ncbi:hypothetical protein Taro_034020 [Colocasia esculenta]|uniref:Uncharacterized protein n=1 Tax=Colocasia esculenta TaxID=4460 RepID=A0A843W2Y9_COLES|nr:hypothetical protein [Colocasia esculenta]